MANLEEEEQQNLAKNLADGLSINIKSKWVRKYLNRIVLDLFLRKEKKENWIQM